ncbi:MAG: hypothetical protein QOG64_349 [Acidimicrobiaceae bacterium]|nr:hypothetical protein [Acidimicrobiaceae bacterium]
MIQLVDQAMEQFLRSAVPLPDAAIDISFDAPDRTWGAAVNRPTVNLFLWDVKRNARFARAGVAERNNDGRVERRPGAAVVDLRYFITAWAAQGRDEHQLLGSVLQCLIRNPILPAVHLPDAMDGTGTISLTLAASDERKPGDFWSALDGRLKPGLELQLTVPIDAFPWTPAGPPTDAIAIGVRPKPEPPIPEPTVPGRPPGGRLPRKRQGGTVVMEGRTASDGGHAPPETEE